VPRILWPRRRNGLYSTPGGRARMKLAIAVV